ncbi:response regulator [Gymnodinialimonas sp. 57CJ19]|uniref:response regulator n=1 Tax=Gymnodinialimonas sp. 57CJ19 TaxID=3138498 RepID=UPI0031346067
MAEDKALPEGARPPLARADSAPEALQRLSHDIRSAMSDVLGGLRLVETARLDPHAQTQIDRIRAAADTLATLVDDALFVATGETQIRPEEDSVIVADWLTTLGQRWAGRAAERGGRFKVVIKSKMPERLSISAIKLERIVGNLVGNALVHGEKSDVVAEIYCEADEGFFICVKDGGGGFPDHVLNADDGGVSSDKGSGLGLSIARALSAEIAADLALSNGCDGAGGCACLMIPWDKIIWTADPEQVQEAPDLSGLRILVAEDNLTNQTILRQMLEAMGAAPVFVTDGIAAMDALRRDEFDIALLDIEMPRMSGLEVMEQVRASEGALAKMPMIAITAYVLRDNREAIYSAGADGIFGKPIGSSAQFGRSILRHVGKLPAPAEGPEHAALVGAGLAPNMDGYRFEQLLDAAGPEGGAELLQRMEEDLTAVRCALDGGIAKVSVTELRAQTHILIAIAGAVGADRLCQLAEVLNIAAKRAKLDHLPVIYSHLRVALSDLLDLIAKRRGTST